MWTVITVRRRGDVLLCVVRWAHPESSVKPIALAEVSLTEIAVWWRDYPDIEATRAEMDRRCARTQPKRRCLRLQDRPFSIVRISGSLRGINSAADHS